MKDVQEFSTTFDVLYNNSTSNQAPGLNEYEKSIYLTKAQNELIKNYFDPNSKGNSLGKGFDESAVRQMDFSSIIKSNEYTQTSDSPKTDFRAVVYNMPTDAYIIINEQMWLKNSSGDTPVSRQVIPISFQEYMRLMSKPFKEPLKRQAWRLIVNSSSANKAEIVLTSSDRSYAIKNYEVRYVKMPNPIILENLTDFGDGVKIEGITASTMCELDESTHDAIVQRAVELAKIAWEGDINSTQMNITSGQRSE